MTDGADVFLTNVRNAGLERLGRIFAIHYHDTIVVGQPTGQDDPPLAFDSSRAQIGAAFPRSIKTIGGLQYFVAQDGSIYTFDGSSTQLVTNAFRDNFAESEPYIWPIGAGAWIDDLRREYTYTSAAVEGSLGRNYLAIVNWETGEIRREFYQNELIPFAAGDKFLGYPQDNSDGFPASRRDASRLTSPFRQHPGGGVSAGGLLRMVEHISFDVVIGTAVEEGILARTYPLDFGVPGVEKVIERVILFMRRDPDQRDGGSTGSDEIRVNLYRGHGFFADQSVTETVTYDVTRKVRAYHFEFTMNRSSDSFVIEIEPNPGSTSSQFRGVIERIVIRYSVHGENEVLFLNP